MRLFCAKVVLSIGICHNLQANDLRIVAWLLLVGFPNSEFQAFQCYVYGEAEHRYVSTIRRWHVDQVRITGLRSSVAVAYGVTDLLELGRAGFNV